MARKPGTLCRFTCHCGTTELVRGGSNHFRCQSCIAAGSFAQVRHGKQASQSAVSSAIQQGLLPRARTLQCTDCQKPAHDYDHRDYNEPLRVEPVCRSCNLKRGPAVPVCGAVRGMMDRGYVPYTLRVRAEQLLKTMRLPTDALAGMPKRLGLEHWRQILPLIESRERDASSGGPSRNTDKRARAEH